MVTGDELLFIGLGNSLFSLGKCLVQKNVNGIEIHYIQNILTHVFTDFKFK